MNEFHLLIILFVLAVFFLYKSIAFRHRIDIICCCISSLGAGVFLSIVLFDFVLK